MNPHNLVPGEQRVAGQSVECQPLSGSLRVDSGGYDARLPAPSHPMTPAEHAQQRAWVIASEMLSPTRSQRHGVYTARKRVVVVVPVMHVYVLPVVREKLL